jgi:hypothetical protein
MHRSGPDRRTRRMDVRLLHRRWWGTRSGWQVRAELSGYPGDALSGPVRPVPVVRPLLWPGAARWSRRNAW